MNRLPDNDWGRNVVRHFVGTLCLIVVAAACSRTPAFATQNKSALVISNQLQPVLLLDDHTVAHTTNLKQEFFSAKRQPSNPILTKTEDWEGVGPYVWGSRVIQNRETGEFRLWYIAYAFEGNFYRWGLATSRDGLHWTKPDLGVENYQGKPAGNCLPLGPHPEKGARSIARDPRLETPDARRYLGARFSYDGMQISFSPDGIVWTENSQKPVWRVPSDVIHVMWDERRAHFVAYFKVWEVAGKEVHPDGTETPLLAYMPSFDQKKRADRTTELIGPAIYFVTNGPAKVEQARFVLRSRTQAADDGGGSSLAGDWTGKRVQAWAESEDGVHWTNERVVLRADELDPPTANIQYVFVMAYGGYYLGFVTLHDIAGNFRIQLAWSSDGIEWRRPWRKAWLDIGAKDAFDSGMVLGPTDPIIWETEMGFPYGGFPIAHDSARQDWNSAIGLATCRLDGFSAWHADETGELITQPFECNGERLAVNADATGGSVAVEVLNEKGKPFKYFEAKSCREISGDPLHRGEAGWVSWNKATLSMLRGKRIQLRFCLKHARLYSFRIADAQNLKLPVPRATAF